MQYAQQRFFTSIAMHACTGVLVGGEKGCFQFGWDGRGTRFEVHHAHIFIGRM